jgi:hypothetical protein
MGSKSESSPAPGREKEGEKWKKRTRHTRQQQLRKEASARNGTGRITASLLSSPTGDMTYTLTGTLSLQEQKL